MTMVKTKYQIVTKMTVVVKIIKLWPGWLSWWQLSQFDQDDYGGDNGHIVNKMTDDGDK